jgi:FtsP/CotA-like multicopper oxidase with cupredoxin domain
VTLRSYGGCKSGPVIDVFPGNTLRVDLHNELDANDPTCKPPGNGDVDESPAECFNTTDLHTHGVHVSPAGNGDNVLLNIALHRVNMRTLSGKQEPGSTGSNYLQPGYRSDVLLVFPEDGDYCLLDQAVAAGEHFKGRGPDIPQLLAIIHVRGGRPVKGDLETYVRNALRAGNPKLPKSVLDGLSKGDLKPWAQFIELAPPPAGSRLQKADFQVTKAGDFQVNGASYKPDIVNIQRQVNTTDDWLLTAEGAPHIFHIHVNPFEIMDVTDSKGESIYDAKGNCEPSMTEAMGLMNQYCGMYHTHSATLSSWKTISRFTSGLFTTNTSASMCSTATSLDHEDAGMTLNIQIVPDLNAPNGGMWMTHNH